MVVIQLKKSEQDTFLYECSVGDSNDKVTRDICKIHNMRERIARLAMACDELAKHGPSKPETEKGIDEIQEKAGLLKSSTIASRGPHYNPDPLGNRDGNAPSPQLQEVIRKTCDDAKIMVSANKAVLGVSLTVAALQAAIDNIKGAVTMAYPMGLPEWDPVRLLIEDDDEGSDGGGPGAMSAGAGGAAGGAAAGKSSSSIKGNGFLQEQMGNEYTDPATASLWWAGKEFFRDQTVGDRVGKNEKTKIVARLQRKGGGPPVREPAISEEERKNMMAWYFKKQEEEKALAEDKDDTYLQASWADPKALKRELLGTTSVGWKQASMPSNRK